jgi:hypothetical protein
VKGKYIFDLFSLFDSMHDAHFFYYLSVPGMTVGVVGEGFGYAVVVVDEGSNQAEPRAYAPTDEEYQECTASLRALLAPG